jgi:hypothetical protein
MWSVSYKYSKEKIEAMKASISIVRDRFGNKYASRIEKYKSMLRECADELCSGDVIEAAIELAKYGADKNNPFLILVILAAAVDIIESEGAHETHH